jgi:hypothetical protein
MRAFKVNFTIYIKAVKVSHIFRITSAIMKLIQNNFKENIVGMTVRVEDDSN